MAILYVALIQLLLVLLNNIHPLPLTRFLGLYSVSDPVFSRFWDLALDLLFVGLLSWLINS